MARTNQTGKVPTKDDRIRSIVTSQVAVLGQIAGDCLQISELECMLIEITTTADLVSRLSQVVSGMDTDRDNLDNLWMLMDERRRDELKKIKGGPSAPLQTNDEEVL